MRRSLAILLSVLGLVAGACGSQASPSPSSAPTATPSATPSATPAPTPTTEPTPAIDPLIEVIRMAADDTVATGTVGIKFAAVFEGSVAIPDGTGFFGEGQASFGEPRQMAFHVDMTAFELGLMTMIVDGDVLYLAGDFAASLIEPGQYLRVDTRSDDPAVVPFIGLTEGQNDNSLAMYYVYGAVGDVKELAPETIVGIRTQHYGLEIDLEVAADLVPASKREVLLDNIAELRTNGVPRTVEAEVWVGADGLIYRTDYLYELSRATGGGTLRATYDFFDFGVPLDLGIPPEELIVDIEDVLP